jgi:hypothetical protein
VSIIRQNWRNPFAWHKLKQHLEYRQENASRVSIWWVSTSANGQGRFRIEIWDGLPSEMIRDLSKYMPHSPVKPQSWKAISLRYANSASLSACLRVFAKLRNVESISSLPGCTMPGLTVNISSEKPATLLSNFSK